MCPVGGRKPVLDRRPKVTVHDDEIAQDAELIRRSRRLIKVSDELVLTSRECLSESQRLLRAMAEREWRFHFNFPIRSKP